MDGLDDTRWATDANTTSAWLEVDLGKPTRFSRATIIQAYPELKRIHKLAIEYLQDGQWNSLVWWVPRVSDHSSLKTGGWHVRCFFHGWQLCATLAIIREG